MGKFSYNLLRDAVGVNGVHFGIRTGHEFESLQVIDLVPIEHGLKVGRQGVQVAAFVTLCSYWKRQRRLLLILVNK